jgi:hypothetical protein
MPSISMFYGIIVYLYYKDTNQHKLPIFTHFTANMRLFLI